MKDDNFDKDELSGLLNRNKDENLQIQAQIKETQQKLKQIKSAKKNDALYKDFIKNQKIR